MATVINFPLFPTPGRTAQRRRRGAPLAFNQIIRGSLRAVSERLPVFGRRQFGIDLPPIDTLAPAHPRLNAIVNESTGVPVGVVSLDYALLQHADVLNAAAAGIASLGIPVAGCEVAAELTPQGEQMAARFTIPGLPVANPLDGHALLPIVQVSNSVDGKSALRANLGWFRLICMNGLVVPYAGSSFRRRHVHGLSFGEVAETVARELARADAVRRELEILSHERISALQLAEWVDLEVRKRWGALAAMRVFHIALRGVDVVAADPFETAAPSQRAVEDFAPVPGANPFLLPSLGGSFGAAPDDANGTLHDTLQALTWVASRGANLQQRWEREAQALSLLSALRADAPR